MSLILFWGTSTVVTWRNHWVIFISMCSFQHALIRLWTRAMTSSKVHRSLWQAGPMLGSSVHNTVHLLPLYEKLLRREKAKKQHIRVWSEDDSLTLQALNILTCHVFSFFFFELSASIVELTVVCSCFSFCTDMIIPSKTLHIFFPNNKPLSIN